jgi:hypothetical protein
MKYLSIQCALNDKQEWVLSIPFSWHMDASWEAMLSVADTRLRLEMANLSRRSIRSLSATRCCISSVSFSCLSRSSSRRCDAACLCNESLSVTALSKASRHVRSSVSTADNVSDTVHDLVFSRDVSCKLNYAESLLRRCRCTTYFLEPLLS